MGDSPCNSSMTTTTTTRTTLRHPQEFTTGCDRLFAQTLIPVTRPLSPSLRPLAGRTVEGSAHRTFNPTQTHTRSTTTPPLLYRHAQPRLHPAQKTCGCTWTCSS